MQIIEVDPDRWMVALGGGLALEVQIVAGRAWGFWRWRGELFAEVTVGEA